MLAEDSSLTPIYHLVVSQLFILAREGKPTLLPSLDMPHVTNDKLLAVSITEQTVLLNPRLYNSPALSNLYTNSEHVKPHHNHATRLQPPFSLHCICQLAAELNPSNGPCLPCSPHRRNTSDQTLCQPWNRNPFCTGQGLMLVSPKEGRICMSHGESWLLSSSAGMTPTKSFESTWPFSSWDCKHVDHYQYGC